MDREPGTRIPALNCELKGESKMSGMTFKKEARDAKKGEKRQLKRQKHAARKQSASEQQSQVSKGNDDARL